MFFPPFFCIVTDYAFNDNNGDIEIKKKKNYDRLYRAPLTEANL